MCGRYALSILASQARRMLEDDGMEADEAVEDDEVRQTYNFAPGYNGLVYRADVPFYGSRGSFQREEPQGDVSESTKVPEHPNESGGEKSRSRYRLQAMKWGLIPFWTKRNPDYGTLMRTINCRDDSLLENKGMWNVVKQKKRCIVICEGFFEWLKKNNGRDRIPHYIKRKDGKLMCFAGLWDCVQYEGSEEKIWTYTIITTDANKQIQFLHNRMPVILENGTDDIRTWLDPKRTSWSNELQSLLKPYAGEIEIYPVSKDVNKVGNSSPSFIVPVDRPENKNNIANFFANTNKDTQKPKAKESADPNTDKQDVDITTSSTGVKHQLPENKDDKVISLPNKRTKTASQPRSSSEKLQKSTSTSNQTTTTAKLKQKPRATKTRTGGNQKITNFFGQ